MLSLIVPPNAIKLATPATDGEMLGVARDWADALAAHEYERAYNMTAHDPYYAWTPTLIREVIEGYGLPEPHPAGPFRVTPLTDATGGGNPRHKVTRYEKAAPGSAVADIWFDLPLNGEWSDLTATFSVCPVGAALVLCLNEIHVF